MEYMLPPQILVFFKDVQSVESTDGYYYWTSHEWHRRTSDESWTSHLHNTENTMFHLPQIRQNETNKWTEQTRRHLKMFPLMQITSLYNQCLCTLKLSKNINIINRPKTKASAFQVWLQGLLCHSLSCFLFSSVKLNICRHHYKLQKIKINFIYLSNSAWSPNLFK